MYFVFFFLTSPWLSLSAEKLKPIQVSGNPTEVTLERSISWPTQLVQPSPLLNSAQTEETLNSLSGIQTRSQGSPTFSIRGSAQSGRALTLFNDIPLNFASSFGAPKIFLPKEMIDKISIIKGPASLFYGSQAMSGSLNFLGKTYKHPTLTITGSDTDESFFPGRGTSLSHNSFHLATPLIKGKKNSLQVSFFNEKDDGRFAYQTQNTSGTREFNSQNLWRAVIKAQTQLESLKLDFDGILGKQVSLRPGSTLFPLITREDTSGTLLSLTPHYFFDARQSLRSRLSFLSSQSQYLENNSFSNNNQQTWILQNEYIFDFNQKTNLQIFADFFSHQLDNSFVGQDLKQNQFELGPLFSFFSFENLKHQIGGRYLEFNNLFLPTVITHFYFSSYESWFSYSQGFKNPTLTDRFSQSPFFVGNPDLTPERSGQFELGIKTLKTQSFWSVDFRLFHVNYKNFIESFELTPGVFSRANQGEGYSRGFDLETRAQFSFMENYLRYNYLDTKNRATGSPFRLSPKHQLSLGALLDMNFFSLDIQNTHWYDYFDMSNNQSVALENWQQWNFFINTSLSSGLSLKLGLINAFNEGKELTLNYPEPQRRYWLQVQYEFL